MKPIIIKADTLGCMVKFHHDDDVYYIGEKVGESFAYQDKKAFRERIGICYIHEYGWFDEVGFDENVPDELIELINRGKVPSGAVSFAGTGYTYQDLWGVVDDWVRSCSDLNDINPDARDEFTDYFTCVLFANLVCGKPEDKINDYNAWDEYNDWLQTGIEDPRLTPQQAKELGY